MPLPVATQMGGPCFAFPDVCRTPAPPAVVPIPYPNIAQLMLALNTSLKVFVQFMPVVTMGSVIPISNGDEPGVAGGMASQIFIGPARFTTGSFKVLMQGMPAEHLGAMTLQNGFNISGVTAGGDPKVWV